MKKHKSLKPIELDAQFKYRCPNPQCGSEHWLFLNQTRVKGFKIVCDCNIVYSVKRIKNIKPIYPKKKIQPVVEQQPEPEQTVEINTETTDHLNKAYKILEHYGFSHKEAVELVNKVHDITECNDPLILVKDSLRIFGGL